MHMEGLIPFISFMDQAYASKFFSRTLNNLTSISLSNSKEIITGFVPSFPKNAYLRPFGSAFSNKPSDVFFSSSKTVSSSFTPRESIILITYGVDDTSSQSNSAVVRDFVKHFSSESLSPKS